MSVPDFYVVARVVGRPGAIEPWKERLVPLCEVSATEPLGHTYYWGQDLDGEPDTLWGLEGYSHAVGFFMGHPASDIFKREMALVDQDQLLKHEQGLASKDYDLHHYDDAGGWYTKEDDPKKNSKISHVVVHHFFAQAGKREDVIQLLNGLAEKSKTVTGVQSCGVLRECNDKSLVTLWVRTTSEEGFQKFRSSELYSGVIGKELAPGSLLVSKTELHSSRTFIGHIDNKKP